MGGGLEKFARRIHSRFLPGESVDSIIATTEKLEEQDGLSIAQIFMFFAKSKSPAGKSHVSGKPEGTLKEGSGSKRKRKNNRYHN